MTKFMGVLKGIAIGGIILAIILGMFANYNVIVLCTLGIVISICWTELRLLEEYFEDICKRKEVYFRNKED